MRRISREPLTLFPDTPRLCARCRRHLPRAAFGPDNSTKDSLKTSCRECISNYDKAWWAGGGFLRRISKTYGITEQGLSALLEAQNGQCAICRIDLSLWLTGKTGRQRRGLNVDHCHDTRRVRGLLCVKCNVALGAADDDPSRLRAMADYIEQRRAKGKAA